eukprot:m.45555 g.45555  ORF g.45555 m.45555 type:complete len:108 (+) comp10263_c0_seq2:1843-2166(+)
MSSFTVPAGGGIRKTPLLSDIFLYIKLIKRDKTDGTPLFVEIGMLCKSAPKICDLSILLATGRRRLNTDLCDFNILKHDPQLGQISCHSLLPKQGEEIYLINSLVNN